ncbi:MAG: hypothetical protein IT439_08285 [Phycisphaerales bacterium]|nr:hypothetical protein [Phycisphaerales bacterium]
MNPPAKSTSLQTYQVIVYDRALHPELFQLRGRRVFRQGPFEAEAWIMRGSHVLRFECGTMCASELVTEQDTGLPTANVVAAYLCAGEHDFEHAFGRPKVTYVSSVQSETLSEHLYLATVEEMRAHARDAECLAVAWDDGGPCLSVLDVQTYNREIHAQGYHLQALGGVVIRTQTIFEVAQPGR